MHYRTLLNNAETHYNQSETAVPIYVYCQKISIENIIDVQRVTKKYIYYKYILGGCSLPAPTCLTKLLGLWCCHIY